MTDKQAGKQQAGPLAAPLLAWYGQHQRALPFRAKEATPYHVWVSEIMGQQTRMAALVPYYQRFVAALPTVKALAECDEERLHKLWEGLGYYSRVRNMQKAARVVMQQYGGRLPANYDALLSLPGIGEYTAGAIVSIAFGLPHPAVDGNVLRVFSRLFAVRQDVALPQTKRDITALVRRQMNEARPGDFNQALMELGALLCLPQNPQCGACPLCRQCEAKRQGMQDELPIKAKKKPPAACDMTVFVVKRGTDVLLQKRPDTGLLAGLWQPVMAGGKLGRKQAQAYIEALLPGAQIKEHLPGAKHVFTHRVWHMAAYLCAVPAGTQPPGAAFVFASPGELRQTYALPGAFKAFLPVMQSALSDAPCMD